MTEILNLLFNPLPNAIMTVLTGFSLLYWLFMMFSGDGLDLDFDGEIDANLGDVNDVDVDITEPSFLDKALEFINVGKVPIMVIVTLFKFIGWIITITSSVAFGLAKFGAWSALILIPVFIVTYFVVHWASKPLVKFFHNIGYKGEEAIDFIGRKGKMKSNIQGEKIGSAEFFINQDVIRLNVVSSDGQPIQYNDDVIVIDESTDKKIYYIQKEINLLNI